MTGNVVEAMFGGRTVLDLIVMRHLPRGAGATVGALSVEPSVFVLRDVEGARLRELRCEVPLLGATADSSSYRGSRAR